MDEAAAIEIAFGGQTRSIDLIKLTVDDAEPEHFAVMAGIGMDAVIMEETDDSLKDKIGAAAYFVAAGLCVRTALAARRAPADVPEGDRPSTWWILSAGLVLLGLNKQLDLQIFVREIGYRFVHSLGFDAERRTLDSLFSSVFLILLSPVALAIAGIMLVTSGRPVLYRGQRVGRRGHFFEMLKFRTLKPGAEERIGQYLGSELVQRTDVELTRVGRWLKASQLDEIPQLWNVLRGDMSFVGPRPIRPRVVTELAHDLPAYWQRLVVRPGLTGFAQVRRGYETSMAEKLAHDLEWIADRSVRLYLRTLVFTGFRVLRQSLTRHT